MKRFNMFGGFIAALVSLFILTGCWDSNNGGTSSASSDGGGAKVSASTEEKAVSNQKRETYTLPVGTSRLRVVSFSEDEKQKNQATIIKLLESAGISIDIQTSYGMHTSMVFRFKEPIQNETAVTLAVSGVKDVAVIK